MVWGCGSVRISAPVTVKIGKLEWNKLRRLPAFKGERAAPPPIFAPEQGRGVQPLASISWECKESPAHVRSHELGFLGVGTGAW
ncbi:hypothetical protein [Paenibacillus solani]|uniref:Uncharacterized protein n=1 Tax=Paenibacillus solani TaxID=1705565 RepID=A0A0M1P0H7_9BACL|nr:hypothetical protein [Paenibacillus solani]KOR87614.1 hypothetical protein AM231_17080 [Paenibacillus solani]